MEYQARLDQVLEFADGRVGRFVTFRVQNGGRGRGRMRGGRGLALGRTEAKVFLGRGRRTGIVGLR